MQQHYNTPAIRPIDPERLRQYATTFSSFGTDYIFSRVTPQAPLADFTREALRLGGLTLVMCLGGTAQLEVNMEPYQLTPNSLMVAGPDTVINIGEVQWDNLDLFVFVMSPDFLRDINFELNLVATINVSSNHPPLLKLTPEEVALITRYFDLIHYNTVDNPEELYVKSISRSLIAAATYQMMQFASVRQRTEAHPQIHSLRSNYVKIFLDLVHRHFRTQRTVNFYARTMCISSKYLSLVIKQNTGRTAAQWIDDYVLLEAKNLLRFSGKNVQQIAYQLNFPNQSAFGKYFKHLCGMSPTQFQKQ